MTIAHTQKTRLSSRQNVGSLQKLAQHHHADAGTLRCAYLDIPQAFSSTLLSDMHPSVVHMCTQALYATQCWVTVGFP